LLLVCGLGNKGPSYKNTRHNVGYLVLDKFAERFNVSFLRKVAGCVVGEGEGILLAKPDTFMNLSGGPVFSLMRKKNVTANTLLVVHDDLDMDFGRLKIRWDGGDGGHKGVRSIAQTLQTRAFYRLKVGIGRDPVLPPEEYVLSPFKRDERETLNVALDKAAEAVRVFLSDGAEMAMNEFNR
jgi:peptidyl-tRNA hydrolase, PTH1 family